jgi:hypothetical protein
MFPCRKPGIIPNDRIPPSSGSPPGFDHGRIVSLIHESRYRNSKGFKKILDVQFVQETGDFVTWSPAERKGDTKIFCTGGNNNVIKEVAPAYTVNRIRKIGKF